MFYLLFPFFCFLLENKKRAWLALICAIIYNFVYSTYFFDENHIAHKVAVNFSARTNILYCAVYLIAGGLIFLYRKELAEFASKYKVIAEAILLIATVAYFAVGGSTLMMLFFCVAAVACTIGCNRGDWSTRSPNFSVVFASRFTCAIWLFIVYLRSYTLFIYLEMVCWHIFLQRLQSSVVRLCSRYVQSGS